MDRSVGADAKHECDHSRHPLFRGDGIAVDDFCCRAFGPGTTENEPNPTHSIVIVRRGAFVRYDGDERLVADASRLLFFNCDRPYRYAHPVPGGDDCTIVMIGDDCLRSAMESRHADARDPFPVGHAWITPRTMQLHLELLAGDGVPAGSESLSREDLVLGLMDAALSDLMHAIDGPGSQSGKRSRRTPEAVEAARLMLHMNLDCPPALRVLAASVDLSPFHFSRAFREHTGLSLRRYLRRLRVAEGLERLSRDASNLSRLAVELGYYDHSHFTNAFCAELGMPPSEAAASLRRRRSGQAT